MMRCFFASDLHGRRDLFERLFAAVAAAPPEVVFLGGDLLPSPFAGAPGRESGQERFVHAYLAPRLLALKAALREAYPRIFAILGNDDGRCGEQAFAAAGAGGLFEYAHGRSAPLGGYRVFGYAYVPPTPFLLKDWERYDVSRYVDPGCVAPEDGRFTAPAAPGEQRPATIRADLDRLAAGHDLEQAVFLFHAPPYETRLDRAALDGRIVDGVAPDPHVGSIAIRRFIEERQPLLTLHGHVHESAALTGSWRDRLGRTHTFSAAHQGPELALVRFDLEDLDRAERDLLAPLSGAGQA